MICGYPRAALPILYFITRIFSSSFPTKIEGASWFHRRETGRDEKRVGERVSERLCYSREGKGDSEDIRSHPTFAPLLRRRDQAGRFFC